MMPHPISAALLSWFQANQRALPWRETYNPYHIWISEIMAQQTQMDRVVAYFRNWCRRLPDIAAVAATDLDTIYKLWEGLGYYNRARNIHRAAQRLVSEFGGRLPADYQDLCSLPGIGPYTAAAIASIAFERDIPVIDANVERIFARLFDMPAPVKSSDNKAFIKIKANSLLVRGNARMYNQALMEFGALICTPRNPKCDTCVLAPHCEALQMNTVHQRPVVGAAAKRIDIVMATGLLRHKGRIYIQKRMADDVWGNLWEFPGGRLRHREHPRHAVKREFAEETGFAITITEDLGTVRHSYTIYRVTLHCFACELVNDAATPQLTAAQEFRWVKPEGLDRFAFPAGHRKLLDKIRARYPALLTAPTHYEPK